MEKNKKYNWVLIKFFGGFLALIGMSSGLLVLVEDTPPGGEQPPPFYYGIAPVIIGILGFIVFAYSDYQKDKNKEGKKISKLEHILTVIIGTLLLIAVAYFASD